MNKFYLLFLIIIGSCFTTDALAQGVDCNSSSPFCTGTPTVFTNSTNVPDLGTVGCLGTTPNPAWYYMQIANPGSLVLNISQVSTAGVGIDVDFICWGPFTSVAVACASNLFSNPGVDCSYSANATETCTIPNALTGQVYILLLTNFSNISGTISFTDSSISTASTDCGIVCNAPNAQTGPALHLDCTFNPVVLQGISSTSGVNFHWTGPNGFSSNLQFPSVNVAGNYTLTVVDPATPNCPSTAHEFVDASNLGAPNVSTVAATNLTCATTSVALNANSTTSSVSYLWTGPGGYTSNQQNPGGITTTGTYTVKVTDPGNGCTSIATETVSTNTTPPYGTTGFTQQITCVTSTVNLSASSTTAGATFSWTGPGGFTSNQQNPTGLSVPGGYVLTVTNPANGCTMNATQFITTNITPPTIGTGTTQTITCTNPQAALTVYSGTGGLNYSWTGPGGFSSAIYNPTVTQPGIYNVTITSSISGCIATASQTVNSNNVPPNLSHGSNLVITCSQPSANLTSGSTTSGVVYGWTGPAAYTSAQQNPNGITDIGVYHLTITNPANGCTAIGDILVTIDTLAPNLTVGVAQTLTCSTTAVNLFSNSSTSAVQYNWSGPNGYSSHVSNPSGITIPGNYIIQVVNPTNGCATTSSQNIMSNTVAPLVATGSVQTITCVVPLVNLSSNSVTPNVIYNWSGPSGFSSALQNPNGISVFGNYTVTVTDPVNGCTATAIQNILLNTTHPVVVMGATQTLNCVIHSVNLAANSPTGNTSYQWVGPNGFTSVIKNPSGVMLSGNYAVTVTDTINGCTSAANQIVLLNNAVPDLNVGPDLNLTCYTPTAKLFCSSATPNALFMWTDSASFSANSTQPTISAAGNYYITVTDPENGCIKTLQEKVISLISYPLISFTADNYSGCQPLSVHFADHTTVSIGTIVSRVWNFGNGDSDFVVTPSTWYAGYGKFPVSMKVMSSMGCVTDTIIDNYIEVYRKPIADFRYTPDLPSIFLPVVDFVDYTQGNPDTWKWDFGDHRISAEQNPSHTFLKSGKYDVKLIVITGDGCKDTTLQIIEVKEEYALYAPTAFTPNNDGENDLFMARGVGITKFSMMLFDRWGKIYFASEELSKGWDGTMDGNPAPQGTYVYKINYTDILGGRHEYINTITLIR